jgi:hypothetical protein
MTPDSTPREVLPPQGSFLIQQWNRFEDQGKTIATMGWMQFWSYLFIGEFAMYQVFAQMKHNFNFDAFYLIKYPD